jgi:hypothetical protein
VGAKDRDSEETGIESHDEPVDVPWWSEDKDFVCWFEEEPTPEFEPEDGCFVIPSLPEDFALRKRLDQIKESHELLRQFSGKELKVLMTLKRNLCSKAWTLREDLLLLTLHSSTREIVEMLKDRNKEAVKKRLQLLKSKGLRKRRPPPVPSDFSNE